MKITAAVVREKGKPFQFEELDLQDPREREVMVKIAASGVCHTDEVAQHQMIPVPLPAVLGHEGCGIVEKVGEGVTEFQKGDHVVFSSDTADIVRAVWRADPMPVRILMPLILAVS
ncbi:MAG: alcohol dehydrogenase catalytic domain-containing protein [Enterocloster sp.]